jgi:hypothetical protein
MVDGGGLDDRGACGGDGGAGRGLLFTGFVWFT